MGHLIFTCLQGPNDEINGPRNSNTTVTVIGTVVGGIVGGAAGFFIGGLVGAGAGAIVLGGIAYGVTKKVK